MKGRFCLIVLYLFFPFTQLLSEPLIIPIHAETAVLMNAESGAILYEKNMHSPCHSASISKIATAIYALKRTEGRLDDLIIVDQESIASISSEAKRKSNYTLPPYWLEQGATHVGIKKGEEFQLKELLRAMLIASANDAANVIAQHVSCTIIDFMKELNEFLKELGCKNTYFCNPHGLHHPKHQTTAFDMALMTRHALKNSQFCEIVSSVRFVRPKTNKQESATYVQTNKLLRNGKHYYPYAIGVKTGYTSHAQNTLVAAAKKDNRTLIAVLLKNKDRDEMFQDAIKMFETAFNQPKVQRNLLKAGIQNFQLDIPGGENILKTYIPDGLAIAYYPAEEPEIKCFLQWKELSPPIKKDQHVGDLSIETGQGKLIKKVPLYALEEVKPTWLQWFKQLF